VPVGGTTSQVLTKTSSTDYATAWQTPSPGLTLPLGQNLTFLPDNTFDIGGSSSTLRPRNVYVAGFQQLGPAGQTLTAGDLGVTRTAAPNTGAIFFGQTASPGHFIFFDQANYELGNGGLDFYITSGNSHAILTSDAANTLAQRNGTNPQTLRLYNSYTDASNYERLSLSYDSGQGRFLIAEQSAGTGSSRQLWIQAAGGYLSFGVNGNRQWWMDAAGIKAATDNTYDIGDPTHRPRNGFFAGAVATGGKAGAAVDGDVTTPTDGMLRFDSTNNRLYIRISGTWRYAALT
jgi:hypothetical protein